MPLKIGDYCPLLSKKCIQTRCAWYTQVAGTDTNTGKQVDEFACAVAWMPMLLIENSGQQRQTGAAVESFRNEMVKANETSQKVLLASLGFQRPQDQPIALEVKATPKAKSVKPKTVRSK